MAPGARAGKPMTDEGMAAAIGEVGWSSESEARQVFRELCERGNRLARSLR